MLTMKNMAVEAAPTGLGCGKRPFKKEQSVEYF